MYSLLQGECLELLKAMPDNSVDAIVCDPPAGIGFMGKTFDSDRGGKYHWVAWLAEIMTECKRVLKPGGHALVWALPRTSHWTANAIEDSGFEIRDRLTHIFGSGFPKSLDIGKAIDKQFNADRIIIGKKSGRGATPVQNIKSGKYNTGTGERINLSVITAPATPQAVEWDGWGTALKPAVEDWWLARKPLERGCSITANVLRWGTGGLNLDACRVEGDAWQRKSAGREGYLYQATDFRMLDVDKTSNDLGRFPPNLILSHSLFCQPGGCSNDCPVVELDAQSGLLTSGEKTGNGKANKYNGKTLHKSNTPDRTISIASSGGASRFYPQFRYSPDELDELSSIFHYFPKASQSDRNAGLEDMPLKTKVFNGRSGKSSEDVHPIEERFTTSTKNFHPCVKSQALMKWLTNLITPKGGTVLDPFMGSGSTGVACITGNFNFIGFELELDYFQLSELRIKWATGESGLFGDLEMSNG